MNRIGTSIDELAERIAAIRASITPERQAEIDAKLAAEAALEARRKVIAVGMPSIFERTPFDVAPLRACRWAEKAWDGSPRNLVVMGDSGAGKTKVACAILAESATHVPCRFATFGDVLRGVRDTYGAEGSESRALAQWTGCRILCLDDIGKEKPTADALHDAVPIAQGIGASAHGERRRQAHGAGDCAPRVRRRGLPGGSSAMLGAK